MKLESGGKVLDVVLAPAVRMEFRDLTQENFRAGSSVTLSAVPSKTAPNEFRGQTITVGRNPIDLR
jgi:hypothetical protein